MHTFFSLLLSAAIPLLIVILWFKKRRQRYDYFEAKAQTEEVVGSRDELLAAEKRLKDNPETLRETLLRDHDLVDRLTTFQGYSREYMTELVNWLRERGIQSDYYFQPSLPLGVAHLAAEDGTFELFVRRDQVEEAMKLLKERR